MHDPAVPHLVTAERARQIGHHCQRKGHTSQPQVGVHEDGSDCDDRGQPDDGEYIHDAMFIASRRRRRSR